jgi:hypothetical protein
LNQLVLVEMKIIAYVQNEANPKYYFGFEICHEIDASELVYANLYRLRYCYMYEFDGTVMSNTGIQYLTAGESEFVYRTDGKADFTGGFHGDEQLTEINFYLDGVRLTDLVTPFALRECSEFFIHTKINDARNSCYRRYSESCPPYRSYSP